MIEFLQIPSFTVSHTADNVKFQISQCRSTEFIVYFSKHTYKNVQQSSYCFQDFDIQFKYGNYLEYSEIKSINLPDIYYYFNSTLLKSIPDRSKLYFNTVIEDNNNLKIVFADNNNEEICFYASSKDFLTSKIKSANCKLTGSNSEFYCYHPCLDGVISKTYTNTITKIFVKTRKMSTEYFEQTILNNAPFELKRIEKTSFSIDPLESKTHFPNCNIEVQNMLLLDSQTIIIQCNNNIVSDNCPSPSVTGLEQGTRYLVKITNADKIFYSIIQTVGENLTPHQVIQNSESKINLTPYKKSNVQTDPQHITCKVIMSQTEHFWQVSYCGKFVCYYPCDETVEVNARFSRVGVKLNIISSGYYKFSEVSIPSDSVSNAKISLKKKIMSMNSIEILGSSEQLNKNNDQKDMCYFIVYSIDGDSKDFVDSCYDDKCAMECSQMQFNNYNIKKEYRIRIIPKLNLLSEEITISSNIIILKNLFQI